LSLAVAEGMAILMKNLPLKLASIDLTKVQTPMKTSELLADIVLCSLKEEWKEFDENYEKSRKKEQRRTGKVICY